MSEDSARDLRYGRRGGGWLPKLKPGEQAVDGEGVLYRCGCAYPWLGVASQEGKRCDLCGEPARRAET